MNISYMDLFWIKFVESIQSEPHYTSTPLLPSTSLILTPPLPSPTTSHGLLTSIFDLSPHIGRRRLCTWRSPTRRELRHLLHQPRRFCSFSRHRLQYFEIHFDNDSSFDRSRRLGIADADVERLPAGCHRTLRYKRCLRPRTRGKRR